MDKQNILLTMKMDSQQDLLNPQKLWAVLEISMEMYENDLDEPKRILHRMAKEKKPN